MKYAVLSDVHGNLEAFSVVLEKCKEIGVDRYVSLGDIVGYNANPKECLEIAQGLDMIGSVKGNHDAYVSSAGETMEGFNPHARAAVLWTKAQLTPEHCKWLAEQPMRNTIRGTNMTIVHATLDSPDTWGYIFDVHHATDNFTYQFTQLCFCGHSHVPLAFCKCPVTVHVENPILDIPEWSWLPGETPDSIDRNEANSIDIEIQPGYKYLINVGSVGQPRNRDPRASFAVYDTETRIMTRYRLPYDIAATQAKIRAAQLPERLAVRLGLGS